MLVRTNPLKSTAKLVAASLVRRGRDQRARLHREAAAARRHSAHLNPGALHSGLGVRHRASPSASNVAPPTKLGHDGSWGRPKPRTRHRPCQTGSSAGPPACAECRSTCSRRERRARRARRPWCAPAPGDRHHGGTHRTATESVPQQRLSWAVTAAPPSAPRPRGGAKARAGRTPLYDEGGSPSSTWHTLAHPQHMIEAAAL